jgi:hypothetical protein
MSSRSKAFGRLGWYVGLLAVLILLGEIVNELSTLVDLNFSVAPLGSQHTPLYVAVMVWFVGLGLLVWSAWEASRPSTP